MGRPKKPIDEDQVRRLAMINCSYAEMAAVLGCTEKTLSDRFYQVIKEGREQGKSSLKRKQYELAMNGNPTMLIWLGKMNLGQRETVNNVYELRRQLDKNETRTVEELVAEAEQILIEAKKK